MPEIGDLHRASKLVRREIMSTVWNRMLSQKLAIAAHDYDQEFALAQDNCASAQVICCLRCIESGCAISIAA
jgi:hypothetical protein